MQLVYLAEELLEQLATFRADALLQLSMICSGVIV